MKPCLRTRALNNALISYLKSFLGLFDIAIVDMSENYFKNYDQYQKQLLTKQELISVTSSPIKNKNK